MDIPILIKKEAMLLVSSVASFLPAILSKIKNLSYPVRLASVRGPEPNESLEIELRLVFAIHRRRNS